jgi:hypothetical protein
VEVTRELQCNPVLKRKNTSAPAEFKVQFRWHRVRLDKKAGTKQQKSPTESPKETKSVTKASKRKTKANKSEMKSSTRFTLMQKRVSARRVQSAI